MLDRKAIQVEELILVRLLWNTSCTGSHF